MKSRLNSCEVGEPAIERRESRRNEDRFVYMTEPEHESFYVK